MKKIYSAPVMYREAYIAEQYVAASDCGTHVGIPEHGHVQLKDGNWHCAFTSSNCGANATSCLAGNTGTSHATITGAHTIRTNESGSTLHQPQSGHNCHILSTNEAARNFVNTYKDRVCGNGVAALMGVSSFKNIETAFS